MMRRLGLLMLLVVAPFATGTPPAGCHCAGVEGASGNNLWMSRPAVYEVFVRDFSPQGNFAGVQNGLDWIQATGANVIWLMPIYPIGQVNKKGPVGSPYSVSDYHSVNPAYGNEGDLHRLVEAAHARNMKVMLDFVANHTAWDHVWILTRMDRYARDANNRISVPFDRNGQPTSWTDTAGLNYKNPDTRQAVITEMRYWLEKFDVDGNGCRRAGTGCLLGRSHSPISRGETGFDAGGSRRTEDAR